MERDALEALRYMFCSLSSTVTVNKPFVLNLIHLLTWIRNWAQLFLFYFVFVRYKQVNLFPVDSITAEEAACQFSFFGDGEFSKTGENFPTNEKTLLMMMIPSKKSRKWENSSLTIRFLVENHPKRSWLPVGCN